MRYLNNISFRKQNQPLPKLKSDCIRATVTDALAYDLDVTVLEDATAAQTSEVHLANLFDMRNMGAYVKTVEEFFSAGK